MEIKDLKQPYRRMAEYLVTQNCIQEASGGIYNFYEQGGIMDLFCNAIDKGHNPPITEEIKKHFPPDFDFSGEDEYPHEQCDDACYFHCTEGGNIKPKCINEKYTQLAREGKFDNLPDTCEFSEAVELEVWDDDKSFDLRKIIGKFKGNYMDIHCIGWNFAQLPTQKIDFSQFKTGDVVEVELIHNEKRIGWFDYVDNNHVVINVLKRKGNQTCNGGSCSGSKMFNLEKIKSITKIK